MNMKNIFIILVLILIPPATYGQTAEKEGISAAIRAGNATALSKYFTATVDITLINVEDVYSKDQAELILNRFFSQNVPSTFVVKHEGKSKRDDYYYIGDLNTSKGTYRLSFFLKKGQNGFQIKQLRIESTD